MPELTRPPNTKKLMDQALRLARKAARKVKDPELRAIAMSKIYHCEVNRLLQKGGLHA